MPDYSTAAASALTAAETAAAGGMVEEVQHGSKRVRFGSQTATVKAVAMLAGLSARQSTGVFRLAAFQEPGE